MSELPKPAEPITAVPPEKVGTSDTVPSYGGVAELGTKLAAMGAGMETLNVAEMLVTEPAEFDTLTVKTLPLSLDVVAPVV
jgi:hypothetical protein